MKTLMKMRSKTALAGLIFALASVIPGSAAVLHVPADYPTIQAAVDAAAASGDTIQIAAGVYTNQVVITNKSLTLSGSPGAILRATPNMQKTLLSIANAGGYPVMGIFMSDVVVSGLTFEGERLGNNFSEAFDGIFFLAASGRVEDCRITGFRASTLTNAANTKVDFGILTMNPYGFGVGPVSIQVLRSMFADNENSIRLYGDVPWGSAFWQPGLLSTTFAVDDNTIIGNGPDTNGWQVGIWIAAGAGGELERNIVTDHDYLDRPEGAAPFSVGIMAMDIADIVQQSPLEPLQHISFEGNILTNNQLDLALMRGDGSTVANNSFEGTAPGYRPAAFWFSGENVTVATNRFSDMQTGIVVIGDDPDWGTSLGIASNAVLVADGFCNVATNYVFEQQATYDLQSTLDCPPPTLNETRAVLLSWPYDIQDYSVESAPTPSGPWTTNTEATVFLQDGQNSAAIPMDSNQQFFRLVKP